MKKILLVAALLCSQTPAFSQPAPTPPAPAPGPAPAPSGQPQLSEEDKAKAKAAYEKGLGHYNLGEFDLAITAFKEAYAKSNAPGLLFNIAQSYRLAKNYEQASYFYRTYLRLKPDAANRADVEARLEEMEKLIEEQKKNQVAPPVGTINPEGSDAKQSTTVPVATTTETTTPEDTGIPPQTLMTVGMVTGGAGAVLLITGVVFGQMAKSAEKDLNEINATMGTWTQEAQDKYDAGKRNNTIAIITYIAGGAALATGGTLYVMGMLKKKNATVDVTPTAGGATASVGWSF